MSLESAAADRQWLSTIGHALAVTYADGSFTVGDSRAADAFAEALVADRVALANEVNELAGLLAEATQMNVLVSDLSEKHATH